MGSVKEKALRSRERREIREKCGVKEGFDPLEHRSSGMEGGGRGGGGRERERG